MELAMHRNHVMIGEAKVSKSGEIRIPQNIARRQKIVVGSRVVFVDIDGTIVLQQPDPRPIVRAMASLERIGKL